MAAVTSVTVYLYLVSPPGASAPYGQLSPSAAAAGDAAYRVSPILEVVLPTSKSGSITLPSIASVDVT